MNAVEAALEYATAAVTESTFTKKLKQTLLALGKEDVPSVGVTLYEETTKEEKCEDRDENGTSLSLISPIREEEQRADEAASILQLDVNQEDTSFLNSKDDNYIQELEAAESSLRQTPTGPKFKFDSIHLIRNRISFKKKQLKLEACYPIEGLPKSGTMLTEILTASHLSLERPLSVPGVKYDRRRESKGTLLRDDADLKSSVGHSQDVVHSYLRALPINCSSGKEKCSTDDGESNTAASGDDTLTDSSFVFIREKDSKKEAKYVITSGGDNRTLVRKFNNNEEFGFYEECSETNSENCQKGTNGSSSRSRFAMTLLQSTGHADPEVPVRLSSINKRFRKRFSDVATNEKVIKYYACAIVADILRQGTLYITENYIAFYSSIIGHVTKTILPIADIANIRKEKTARFIPNAIGIEMTDGKTYVFSSLISRDGTFKFMDIMIKTYMKSTNQSGTTPWTRTDDLLSMNESRQTRLKDISNEKEVLLVNSAALNETLQNGVVRKSFQDSNILPRTSILFLFVLLFTAIFMEYKTQLFQQNINFVNSDEFGINLYEEILREQQKLHSDTAEEFQKTIGLQINHLAKVRQSLEAVAFLLNNNPHQGTFPTSDTSS